MIDEQSAAQHTAELARLLRDARAAKGWTLRQAAGHTGISNGYLSLIEQGDVRSPSPRYLMILAESYGLAFDRLMALAGHPSGPGPSLTPPGQGDGTASGVSAGPAVVRMTLAAPGRSVSEFEPADVAPAYGAEFAAGTAGDASQPDALSSADKRHAHTPDSAERRQLTALVLDDLRALSTSDIAQVRAFIAGLRAARRS